MNVKLIRATRAAVAALVVLAIAPVASAQYPGYGYPTYYGREGGALMGQAAVIDAYGNLGLQQEQAYIMREKANQEKLVTKKKTFDQLAYERENKFWFSDELDMNQQMLIRRVTNHPTEPEIINGTALNILLPFLSQVAQASYHGGPPVPIDQSLLKQVNVSSGTATGGPGLLKDGGKVTWPFVLRSPMQEQLDPLLEQAVGLAAQNKLTPANYNKCNKLVKDITEDLRKQFHREEIDGAAYLEGKRFLESLESSVALLKSPNASKYFTGAFTAKGATVDELVVNMTKQGLKFAKAQPGSEDAYFALHTAFQTYSNATVGDASSFRVRTAKGPPQQSPQQLPQPVKKSPG